MTKNRETPVFTIPVSAADEALIDLWMGYFKKAMAEDEHQRTALQREQPHLSKLYSGTNYELNPYVERDASKVFVVKKIIRKIFGIKDRHFHIVSEDGIIMEPDPPSSTTKCLESTPLTPIRYLLHSGSKYLL